jgi:hypothetical protein
MKTFFVTTYTWSPRTKCGVVDNSKRADISSLCRYNTVRTKTCIYYNNSNRSDASCETVIEGRMLNNRLSGSSREKTKIRPEVVVFNSERLNSVVRKSHLRQQFGPF